MIVIFVAISVLGASEAARRKRRVHQAADQLGRSSCGLGSAGEVPWGVVPTLSEPWRGHQRTSGFDHRLTVD